MIKSESRSVNTRTSYFIDSKQFNRLIFHLAFSCTKRSRESRPMDTVAFWVKLLSLEFPWPASITSQGKAIVLSHKHKHMHEVHVYTLFLMQFTEPCPIMA